MLPKYAPPTAFVIIVEVIRVSQKERGEGRLIISKPSGHIQTTTQQTICGPVNSKASCFTVELVKRVAT
jgi:glucose-6-phosphate 1-dehydrogenase